MPPKSTEKPKPTDCDLCRKGIVWKARKTLSNVKVAVTYGFTAIVQAFPSLTSTTYPTAPSRLCYACCQRSQLAVTKQLRSEVAHLKGETNKLYEQLVNLSSTASLRNEATVTQTKAVLTAMFQRMPLLWNKAATLPIPHILTCMLNPHLAVVVSNATTTLIKSSILSFMGPLNALLYMNYDTNLVCKTIKSICPDIGEYVTVQRLTNTPNIEQGL